MSQKESHFREACLLVILSTLIFIGLKEQFPKELFSGILQAKQPTKGVVVDSMLLEAIASSESSQLDTTLDTSEDSLSTDSSLSSDSTSFVRVQENLDANFIGVNQLASFYEELHSLAKNPKGNVRIAYFGDSQTDGDIIVSDIRALFQNKFGGKGVGFVPITSESANCRSTIVHSFSSLWKSKSFLKGKRSTYPYGVAGTFATTHTGDSTTEVWLKFKGGIQKANSILINPTLFYGRSANISGKVQVISENDTLMKDLSPSNILNTLELTGSNSKKVDLSFMNTDSIPFYGCNFDDGVGVHVDNYSSRGNSGLPLGVLDTETMNAFQNKLGYDLLILQYGTNLLGYGSNSYGWYKKRMTTVINHLKKCFPGVAILVISTADKASKYETEMKTDSAVIPLLTAQREYAIATGCGFMNLYSLMGGDSSMISWVNDSPAKASKDYTHFNARGAKVVAQMLFGELDKGYTDFVPQRTESFTGLFNSAYERK